MSLNMHFEAEFLDGPRKGDTMALHRPEHILYVAMTTILHDRRIGESTIPDASYLWGVYRLKTDTYLSSHYWRGKYRFMGVELPPSRILPLAESGNTPAHVVVEVSYAYE